MFNTSRNILLVLSALLVSSTAWSAVIQGEVRGPDGKPIAGAEVRLDRADKKGAPNIVKTDQHGQYTFAKVDLGNYKLVAAAKDMATTASDKVKTKAEGVVRVDFNLKKQTVAAAPKKKTHKVWVHSDTGSNIGGKWVEVADDDTTAPMTTSTGPSTNNLSRGGNDMVRGIQQSGGGGTGNAGSGGH
jgi:hypothetical protein